MATLSTKSTRDLQSLMDSAYDKFGTACDAGRAFRKRYTLDGITNLEKVACLLGNFNFQTCNGGLEQYCYNDYAMEKGKYGISAYRALEAVIQQHRSLDEQVASVILLMLEEVGRSRGKLSGCRFDCAYYAFKDERVEAFLQAVVDNYDADQEPFVLAHVATRQTTAMAA